MSKKITDWGLYTDNDYEDIRTFKTIKELVEHELEGGICKDTLEIIGYCRKEFDAKCNAEVVLDNFLESLDEDTGADVFTEPTETMKKASLDFVKTVLSEYPRYELEMIEAKTIKIKDYIGATDHE